MKPRFLKIHSSVRDSSYLMFFHLANQIIPFFAIPFLSHRLGLQNFGLFAFLSSIVMFSCVITDYGFNLSGTIKIARNKENQKYLNKLISVILSTKLFIAISVSILIVIYLYLINPIESNGFYIPITVIAIIGQSFQLQWFFQGLERTIVFYKLIFLSRCIYLAGLLFLVNKHDDLIIAYSFYAFSQFTAFIMSWVIMRKMGYFPNFVGIRSIKRELQRSFHFFLSRAFSSVYTIFGSLVLGVSGLISELAVYAAAEHLYKSGQSLLTPISQTYFPLMIRTKNFFLIKRVIVFLTISTIIVAVGFINLSSEIVDALYGSKFIDSGRVFDIFVLGLVFYVPSIFLGYPVLGAVKKTHIVNNSVILGGIFQILFLLILILTDELSALTVAIGLMIAEALVLIVRAYFSIGLLGIKFK